MATIIRCGTETSTGTAQAQGLTRYLAPGATMPTTALTVEADAQIIVPVAGTISMMSAYVTANTLSGAATLTLRVNGAASALTISIGAGATGQFTNSTNSVSVAAGDKIAIERVTAAGSGSITHADLLCLCESTNNAQLWETPQQSVSWPTNASATLYAPVYGNPGFTLGTDRRSTVTAAGTWRGLGMYVTANTRTSTTTITSRINGSLGTQTFSIPAGATGFFSDTTHTDALAAGDEVNIAVANGTGAGALTVANLWTWCESATPDIWFRRGTTLGGSFGTVYGPIPGAFLANTTQRFQAPLGGNMRLSKLQMYVASNARSTATTALTHVNGAPGAQTLSIAAGATGLFSDASNADTVSAGSTFAVSVVAGSGTGSFSFDWMGLQTQTLATGSEQAAMY